MREIKFRAWHKGRMVDMDELCSVIMGDYSALILDILGGDEPEASLMQFTGLKDKNGKEIYEGDILQGSYGIPPVLVRSPVIFKNAAFYASTAEHTPLECLLAESIELLDFEIIGNIHENPELLDTV